MVASESKLSGVTMYFVRNLIILLAAISMTEFLPQQTFAQTAGYDRPAGDPKQSRSVVLAKNGMVATSHPLAADAGLDILKAGGNAVDAAIAANAMLGVVEPMSCGIGGDVFVIYWNSKTKKLYGLNGSGRSPHSLTTDEFKKRGLAEIPISGVLPWSTPGCVHGWQTLHDRFGELSLKEILQPAIHTAEDGFAVPQIIAAYWKAAEPALKQHADSADTFLIDGRAPKYSEVFRNPNLAKSYRLIAEQGAAAFYEGPIAAEIDRFSKANGGFLSAKDLADHTSQWVEPVSTTYRGVRVWELPPNGQGIAALQMLNTLEPFDIAKMGYGSADYLHLLVESKKLAFADRAKFYSDPDFNELPTEALISKAYAQQQVKRIDPKKAADNVPAGDPQLQAGDTVYITVVDKDRNCCSFIQSNYYGFGSKVVPGNVGFVLQNRGALFALADDHFNKYEPHKRPFHTIIPAMATKAGKPWFCFGVMGGDMQPQGHVQVLVNLIDFQMNIQAAGDAARVRHIGSAQPTGSPASGSGTVQVESGVEESVVKQLTEMGHRVVRSKGGFGGYQGILIDHENGVLRGATESRKDGAAVGY